MIADQVAPLPLAVDADRERSPEVTVERGPAATQLFTVGTHRRQHAKRVASSWLRRRPLNFVPDHRSMKRRTPWRSG